MGMERGSLVAAQITKTKIVPLSEENALLAAEISLKYTPPMADAIVYPIAMKHCLPCGDL